MRNILTRKVSIQPFSLNKHHNYLALLLLNNDADLVQHLSALLRGDGLTLLLDRGALHLLHTGVDLVLAGAALLLVHRRVW